MLLKLKDLGYNNIFSGPKSLGSATNMAGNSQFQLGVDTNVATKPAMIGALQHLFLDQRIKLQDSKTIFELQAYEQKPSESGRSYTFQGTRGAHDDRVMALALAVFPVWLYPASFMDAYHTPAQVEKERERLDKQFNHEYADFARYFNTSDEGDPFA